MRGGKANSFAINRRLGSTSSRLTRRLIPPQARSALAEEAASLMSRHLRLARARSGVRGDPASSLPVSGLTEELFTFADEQVNVASTLDV